MTSASAVSAAAVCLASALTACGGGSGGGYTAVGAAGGTTPAPARPTGSVTLVPLDGAAGGTGTGNGTGDTSTVAQGPAATGPAADSPSRPSGSASPSSRRGSTQQRPGDSTAPNSPGPGTTSPTTASPAALTWSTPTREATDKRWCEKVTVAVRNSGGTAVRSGSVTLGTHVIDLLGIDWATIRTTETLPAPIAADSGKNATWTVCVDDWRVPLGMHIETRVVTVDWS
ncbi:hypothetical protein [Streptomyces sp. NPDC048282]|uniref:hypothetical protein n=1 Tax=Streptomyces sp. NPDC048282 TaxID=3365528 RepID=UPI0037102AF3